MIKRCGSATFGGQLCRDQACAVRRHSSEDGGHFGFTHTVNDLEQHRHVHVGEDRSGIARLHRLVDFHETGPIGVIPLDAVLLQLLKLRLQRAEFGGPGDDALLGGVQHAFPFDQRPLPRF